MKKHVKIKTVGIISVSIVAVLACFCIFYAFYANRQYEISSEATLDYISAEKAIKRFEMGSNKLNRQVRLAISSLDQKYIDEYFVEFSVINNRQKAIDELEKLSNDCDTTCSLDEAMELSNRLVESQKYILRLIEESIEKDKDKWPTSLLDVELKDVDKNLNDLEKIERAKTLIGDTNYETTNMFIMNKVSTSLNKISNELLKKQDSASKAYKSAYMMLEIGIGLFVIEGVLICLSIYFLIIKPLLILNENIKENKEIPLVGAYELRTVANTYNEVYRENEAREMLIKHKSEHDPLTGLLNRGTFDSILNLYVKDENNFALILIDVDTFKSINDTYGHAVGDIILKKVADLLTLAFRSIDHVCRIGGDEFAIIMVDMNSELNYTISDKINEINIQLRVSKDGEPTVSISVGIALSDRENPGEDIFRDADKALYQTKERGRNGYTFY